MADLTCCS